MFLPGLNEHFKTIGKKKIPKKPFPTQEAADFAIMCMNDKTAKSYKCSVCGKWHIGH
jgi:hypothetical protein